MNVYLGFYFYNKFIISFRSWISKEWKGVLLSFVGHFARNTNMKFVLWSLLVVNRRDGKGVLSIRDL